jgi:hypothetical protein
MEYAAESAALERSVALALTHACETARDLVTRYGDPTGSAKAYAEAENRAAKAAFARARNWDRVIEIAAGRA